MGILGRPVFALCLTVFLGGGEAARGDFLPMVSGIEVSAKGALGTEYTDFYGLGADLEFGNFLDQNNLTGDFHLNYTDDIEPQDAPLSATPVKNVIYWSGGFSVNPWRGGRLGLDYDSYYDSFESLYTQGVKVSLGQGPFTLSYRNAETQLSAPTGFYILPTDQARVKFNGAFMFQESLDLSAHYKPSKSCSLLADVSASWYTPNAADFTSLLSTQALSSLGNLQDALQNYEQWTVNVSWRQKWSQTFETKVSQLYSNLIVAANPYTITTVTFGFHWTPSYYTGLSYEYQYTPVGDTSFAILELRWNWDRDYP